MTSPIEGETSKRPYVARLLPYSAPFFVTTEQYGSLDTTPKYAARHAKTSAEEPSGGQYETGPQPRGGDPAGNRRRPSLRGETTARLVVHAWHAPCRLFCPTDGQASPRSLHRRRLRPSRGDVGEGVGARRQRRGSRSPSLAARMALREEERPLSFEAGTR